MRYLLFIFLSAIAVAANATAYYVSDCGSGASAQCVAGDDSNAGTSPSAPWKTCAKVGNRFDSLAAGDQILFARGSAQNACTFGYLSNSNSRASNPIVVGAYTPTWATGSAGAPLLRGVANAYTLALENSGDATHDEGYLLQDLHFVGAGVAAALPAIIMSNDVDHVTVQRVEIEQYVGGIQCDGGTNHALAPGSDGLSEHMIIRNSSIHHNRGIGILTSCNDTLIENNTLDNNGVGMLDHQIYLDDASLDNVATTTTQIVIRGNTLTNNASYASKAAAVPTAGSCGAVAIVVHGLKDGLIIENNFVSEPTPSSNGSCWGIALDSGGYTGIYAKEGFRNVAVRGNTVINYALGVGVDLCDSCTVENNYIYSESQGASGVVAPDKYADAAIAGNGLNNQLTVRNNTVYLRSPTSGSVGIRVSRDGSAHVVASNLIYFGGNATSATACFNTAGLPAAAFTAFDYNQCYFSATSGVWEATRGPLESQRAAGMDAHSLASDPHLAISSAPLFTPAVRGDSSALRAGHPSLSSKFGIGGVLRGAAPDIGAFQQGASIVVPNSPTGLNVQ